MLGSAAPEDRLRVVALAGRDDDALPLDDPRHRRDEAGRDALAAQLAIERFIRRVVLGDV